MARKSLRPYLNQIRAWTRQGRTDAWVAHQLEVSVKEVEEFKRQLSLLSEPAVRDQYIRPTRNAVWHEVNCHRPGKFNISFAFGKCFGDGNRTRGIQTDHE